MRIFAHKKAEAVTIILVIVLIILFLGYLISISGRECRSDAQCGSGNYCGSDFACHKIPTIEKTIVKNNLIVPSIIIGIAIVVAAIVLRRGKGNHKESNETKQETKSNPLKVP